MQNICLITYTHIDQQQQQTRGLLLLQQQPLKPGIEAEPSPNQEGPYLAAMYCPLVISQTTDTRS